MNSVDVGLEHDHFVGVTHPSVVNTVSLFGSQVRTEEVATCLKLLGKGDHVWRLGESPLFMGPEGSRRASTGLHLIHDEEGVVAMRYFLQVLEEVRSGVVVSSFGLDRFYNNGSYWTFLLPVDDSFFCLLETPVFFCPVLLLELVQGVFEGGEFSHGEIVGRDV